MDSNFDEKRKYVRLDFITKVSFGLKGENIPEISSGKKIAQTKNISIEGICFSSDRDLKPGDKLDLEIQIENNFRPIHISGVVKWSNPQAQNQDDLLFDVGLEILSIDNTDEDKFMEYVWGRMKERLTKSL